MDNYREQAPFPAQGLYDPRLNMKTVELVRL